MTCLPVSRCIGLRVDHTRAAAFSYEHIWEMLAWTLDDLSTEYHVAQRSAAAMTPLKSLFSALITGSASI